MDRSQNTAWRAPRRAAVGLGGAAILGLAIVAGACTAPATPAAAPPAASPTAAPVTVPSLPQPAVAPPVNRTSPATVKVDLETKEVTAQLDDGIAYTYFTFGGTVPGPMIRVHQGDTVELTLRNAKDSGFKHSIDLHAVTGPGGGATVTQLAAGEDATFRFEALNPGVYVYHCATPSIPHHITNGMYGLIVVEPPEGLPKVDREFYVMQGELYLDGNRGDKGQRNISFEKMRAEQPDYVVFNGSVGALTGEKALKAKVGETIRIFFGVGGPNLTSSFHVIGEIFDRVYAEGGTTVNQHVQTTHVPTGGATIAEFKTEVPGHYLIVDHSLSRLEKGGLAMIEVEGPENPAVFQPLRGPAGSAAGSGH